jgi:hypothetical protein
MERQSSPSAQNFGDAMTSVQGTITKATETGKKADQAAARVGEKFGNAADTLRGTVSSEGRFGPAAETVADKLESAGNYLREQGVTGAREELESLIRRYPIQALLLGAGLGYALSRLRMRSQ